MEEKLQHASCLLYTCSFVEMTSQVQLALPWENLEIKWRHLTSQYNTTQSHLMRSALYCGEDISQNITSKSATHVQWSEKYHHCSEVNWPSN